MKKNLNNHQEAYFTREIINLIDRDDGKKKQRLASATA